MLNSMREGQGANIVKFIALGFVLLATLGMVFMDVGGFFRSGLGMDTTLAQVGRVKIDQPAFERQARAALQAQNMTMQEAYRFGLLRQLLEDITTTEALRQEATTQGIVISRDQIASRVHDMVKGQIQPGETAQQTLDRLLQAQGLSEQQMMNSMRAGASTQMIEAPLTATAEYMPRLTAQALGRYQAERRDIMFFTLTAAAAGAAIKSDDDTLKAYYETVKDQYQLPEERTFKALVLSADDVRDTIKITDADIQAAYNERKDQFRTGERRNIEQLILPDEAKAKAAFDAVQKGKSMKSVDANAYRAPMDVDQTALPVGISAAVFAADKNTLLNPVKTPLGWSVIRVRAVVPARTQTLAEVRDGLAKELESDALHSEMDARISKVDELLGSGVSLAEAAQQLNLTLRTVGPIDAQGNFKSGETQDALLTSLAQNKDMLAGLFELMEGETGDLGEVNENTYAAFSLENVRPTRDQDFAVIRAQVEKKWLDEQRHDALNAQVEKLANEISKGEKDFAEAAKEAGAVLKTARDVGRDSKVAGLNDPVALTRLFDETDLKAVVKVPTDSGTILAQVLAARLPAPGTGALTADAEKQARTQMQQAIDSLFLADLRARHKVKINDDHLEKLYGAGADAPE